MGAQPTCSRPFVVAPPPSPRDPPPSPPLPATLAPPLRWFGSRDMEGGGGGVRDRPAHGPPRSPTLLLRRGRRHRRVASRIAATLLLESQSPYLSNRAHSGGDPLMGARAREPGLVWFGQLD
jgi:hypothetical protein